MPGWGELFADAGMQTREPDPELIALIPFLQRAGCRLVLDAGCGVGRQLVPLLQAGFQVWGVDSEANVLEILQNRLGRLSAGQGPPHLAQADLKALPFASAVFDLVVSIKVINHGFATDFQAYCRELDRVLRPGGYVFIMVSPWEFAEKVKLPQTRELEPHTLVDIATPDGSQVHHFPTPEELREQFPGYQVDRCQTHMSPIMFMGAVEMPQLLMWAEKQN